MKLLLLMISRRQQQVATMLNHIVTHATTTGIDRSAVRRLAIHDDYTYILPAPAQGLLRFTETKRNETIVLGDRPNWVSHARACTGILPLPRSAAIAAVEASLGLRFSSVWWCSPAPRGPPRCSGSAAASAPPAPGTGRGSAGCSGRGPQARRRPPEEGACTGS